MNYKTMCSIRMSVAKCVHESRFNLRLTRNVSHSRRSNLSAQNKSQKTANSPEPNFSSASFILKQPNNANTSEHTHTDHSEGWQVNPNIIWTDAWARPSHRFGVRERRKKRIEAFVFQKLFICFFDWVLPFSRNVFPVHPMVMKIYVQQTAKTIHRSIRKRLKKKRAFSILFLLRF